MAESKVLGRPQWYPVHRPQLACLKATRMVYLIVFYIYHNLSGSEPET